jgi:hypothetical protein
MAPHVQVAEHKPPPPGPRRRPSWPEGADEPVPLPDLDAMVRAGGITTDQPFLFIGVLSSRRTSRRRTTVRNTWLRYVTHMPTHTVDIKFVLSPDEVRACLRPWLRVLRCTCVLYLAPCSLLSSTQTPTATTGVLSHMRRLRGHVTRSAHSMHSMHSTGSLGSGGDPSGTCSCTRVPTRRRKPPRCCL